MRIFKLKLHQFRSFASREIEFTPETNHISGRNGSGKTTILEAIHVLSTGRSFRTHMLRQLIQNETDYFFAEMEYQKEGVNHTLSLGYKGDEKRLLHNGTLLPTFTGLYGLFPIVAIVPSDTLLIAGSPSDRRRFLDSHISQLDPHYLEQLLRYHHALKQRNAGLKVKCYNTVPLFEAQMATANAYLVERRRWHLNELCQTMQKISFGEDDFSLHYEPSIEANFEERYAKNREKEMILSTTLAGAHRDDFAISSQNISAKATSSEGQKHSFAILIKLAQWQQLLQTHQIKPLLCIDDFGVHLDPKRQILIEKVLQEQGQIILTSPSHAGELQLSSNLRECL